MPNTRRFSGSIRVVIHSPFVLVWFVAMALTACESTEPPAGRGSSEPVQDGAKWMVRDNFDGGAVVLTFELRGKEIRRTLWLNDSSKRGVVEDDTYAVNDNKFYIPRDTNWCYQIVSTSDCGLLGTITADAIYFTRMANGKRSSDQRSLVGENLTPIRRMR
jgi:hypothetical protein